MKHKNSSISAWKQKETQGNAEKKFPQSTEVEWRSARNATSRLYIYAQNEMETENLGLYPPKDLVTQALLLILHRPTAHINEQR